MKMPWRNKLSRRRAIIGMGACLGGAVAAGTGAKAAAVCLLTPDSGAGPFYFDPGLVRADIRAGQPGAPLDLSMQIISAGDCAPLENARVDLWHANALGLYSGYGNQRGVGGMAPHSVNGQDYLRGIQFTDAQGRAGFHTIYPSWYYGRTPHVHFKILLDNREVLASQVFFPDDVNEDVLSNWDPYREYAAKRNVTNANDMFLRNGIEGVFCEVERTAEGYEAALVIAVAPPARR